MELGEVLILPWLREYVVIIDGSGSEYVVPFNNIQNWNVELLASVKRAGSVIMTYNGVVKKDILSISKIPRELYG